MARSMERWLRILGWPGILALGICLFVAGFHYSAIIPAGEQVEIMRKVAARAKRGADPAARVAPKDDLAEFYAGFPSTDDLTAQLESIYDLARAQRLELRQGKYRLNHYNEALSSYQVSLPVRGPYSQVRGFVASVLDRMPLVALDNVRFEKQKIGDPGVDAQLRFVVYLRRSATSPRP